MDTHQIADTLKLTAQLMELHDENPFKVKSLTNAAFKLSKSGLMLEGLAVPELEKIEGIGKSIAQKIFELNTKGEIAELADLLLRTPVGVIDMMRVKGLGPKKVRQLWKELEIESVGELLYACNENRLIELKGFGSKTQESVKNSIDFLVSNVGKFHYAKAEAVAFELVNYLEKKLNTELVSLTGAIRRKCEIIEEIEIIVAADAVPDITEVENSRNIPVRIIICKEDEFYLKLWETTGSVEHLKELAGAVGNGQSVKSENDLYKNLNIQYIEPELREGLNEIELAKENKIPKLVELADLRGTLHNHSKYSDGTNTLAEMAEYAKEIGLEYLGICDHSQTAVYAGGLLPEKIIEQHAEIEKLNQTLAPFKIFKGIESDILNDGSLDYNEEILKTFDFVLASVHSNLKMDEEKANRRLLKAIENPYTTMLGHPTGRLLLSRPGYPLDFKMIIDACAANKVIIELNANPHRLDIDWRWINYCMEKGVKISINPDAHSKKGYHDMYYGVCAARKGMLTKEMCFNAMGLGEMESYFGRSRKS